jgi:hypothetical protein
LQNIPRAEFFYQTVLLLLVFGVLLKFLNSTALFYVLLVVWFLALSNVQFQFSPGIGYVTRIWAAIFIFFYTLYVLKIRRKQKKEYFNSRSLIFIIISMSSLCINSSLGFLHYTQNIQQAMRIYEEPFTLEATKMSEQAQVNYSWYWANPSLSLILRENRHQPILKAPVGTQWFPVDVDSPYLKEGLFWYR